MTDPLCCEELPEEFEEAEELEEMEDYDNERYFPCKRSIHSSVHGIPHDDFRRKIQKVRRVAYKKTKVAQSIGSKVTRRRVLLKWNLAEAWTHRINTNDAPVTVSKSRLGSK
ncbi:MAG: hypothetical protein PUP46_10465 [Endozoicomonas sp. (ex Botrylloides leachii)]|nr:hypothetical protein [Endozoicomonas sp. (ex Botrylloides leachii)]